ncbi:serine hydrolase [Flavobacterium sp. Sd200]|uniref:serine hydrolase domain-containing protein n=1 Tax=Flavobacterium sp. Sd200 TaxID=2692211 RepID=UPI0013693F48|nr:serine hydrolase domain-containing protein [Flavobacterium sp. Sd200]MXN91510.1 serine hydrolase [Flavobacterium sp. Sd200]
MKTLGLLFTFLISIHLYSQNSQIEKELDALFEKDFSEKTPGCSVLISQNGNTVYNKAFGSANLELDVPLKTTSVFSIASITKQFTAIAILQLVEKGKIRLDDNLDKYIDGFEGKGIEIQHLLSHTSGLKDYLQVDTGQKFGERMDYTPLELIDIFKKIPLEFVPGTAYKYCNSDYILLGYIIEKVSGRKYADYLKDNIFIPLKMDHTFYDSNEAIIPNRVSGYFKDGSIYKKAEFWSATVGYSAGGLLSNTSDLEKWNNGLLSYSILNKELLDKAFTPYKLNDGTITNYGLGWNVADVNGIKKIDHGGNKNGFISYEGYFPEKQLYIVLLFNSENAERDKLAIRVSEIMIGKSLQNKVTLTDEILQKYTGKYQLVSDAKRTMTIIKEKSGLVADISGQGKFPLIFQSQTQFQLSNLLDIKCEFKLVNGNPESIIVSQNGAYEWKKIR